MNQLEIGLKKGPLGIGTRIGPGQKALVERSHGRAIEVMELILDINMCSDRAR